MRRTAQEIFNVQNKVVCVTGAAGLLGKTIAGVLYANQAKLILTDLDTQQLHDLYGNWDRARVVFQAADICIQNQFTTLIKKGVDKFGGIDVLINNAAIDAKFEKDSNTDLAAVDFADFPIDKLQNSINVNIIGTVKATQVVLKQMLLQGSGNVINLASTYSLVAPNPGLYANDDGIARNKPMDYVVTKSVIPNLTRYLAAHYAKQGIRCNALAPHAIENNHASRFKESFARFSPMGRMSLGSELEGAILYLASDASSYMTGHVLVVDGGWTVW